MLFNSFSFVYAFLPATLAIYYFLTKSGFRTAALYFLAFASLVFYAMWSYVYAGLLCVSLAINYAIGLMIQRSLDRGGARRANLWMAAGVSFNICTLLYFKYTNFFIDNINVAFGASFFVAHVVLPLGISFYTFQKIALLVDLSRGVVRLRDFGRFALFVLFFPQLIAGPIVHFKEIAPQFARRDTGRNALPNLAIGSAIFAMGLFKKTVLADTAVLFSAPVYAAAQSDAWSYSFWLGWQGALAYTLQLYFDFSGYTDMAVGLGRMFGVRLPQNFFSPHKADNIADYWRRWHMTLQRFLLVYLFQPIAIPMMRLSMSRDMGPKSAFLLSRVFPTLAVFIVSGFWHGAGWTFIVWGIMHGCYVSVQELWIEVRGEREEPETGSPPFRFRFFILTFLAVVASNVMFRAETVTSGLKIYAGMLNLSSMGAGFSASRAQLAASLPVVAVLAVGFFIIFFMPNSQQIMRRYGPALAWQTWRHISNPLPAIEWRANFGYAIATGVVLALGLLFIVRGQSAFIYFNF